MKDHLEEYGENNNDNTLTFGTIIGGRDIAVRIPELLYIHLRSMEYVLVNLVVYILRLAFNFYRSDLGFWTLRGYSKRQRG